jgi:hypothetical protein
MYFNILDDGECLSLSSRDNSGTGKNLRRIGSDRDLSVEEVFCVLLIGKEFNCREAKIISWRKNILCNTT